MSIVGNLYSSSLGNQSRSAHSSALNSETHSGLALSLADSGYERDTLTGVWCKSGQDDFGYNDGDSVENRI